MSNLHPHPQEAALLRWLDGELPPGEAREMERHLEGCGQCRAEVEDLRDTLADCLRYRQQVLEAWLPPPPQPWADLRGGFGRIDAELGRTPWWRRLGAGIHPPVRWALAAAAALMVACGIFYQLRETPSVQAAALLERATVAAQKLPPVPRRVRIRSKTAQMVRAVGTAASLPLPQEPQAPALEALFQAAHWGWEDPLSARAFAGWRGSLSEKHDAVTSADGAFKIRTETTEGELAAASLTLRAADLRPTAARLEFRNQDWVEMSEVTEDRTENDGATVAPPAFEPSVRRAEPSRSAASPSGETASISGELQVLAALHGIEADLGDPVEVSRAGGRVMVSGVGIAPQRQQQIHQALDGIPNVSVDFPEPVPGGAPASPGTPPASQPPAAVPSGEPPGVPSGAGVAGRVERQLGGHPQFQRFSSQMLDWNESALSRAYAIERLAQRFPAGAEASLSAADRRTLRQMTRDHAAALAGVLTKMRTTLEPVLAALGGRSGHRPQPAEAWQPAAEDLLVTAQHVELQLSVMLGVAPADGSTFSASQLLADLAHLDDDIARCQSLLALE